MEERILVFLKPDGFIRRYTGARLIKELFKYNFNFEYFGEFKPSKDFIANKHYAEHKGKPFYEWLVNFITSAPILVIILSGENVAQQVRSLLGATICEKADPGSIRGKYGLGRGINVAHASESSEAGRRETELWSQILNIDSKVDYRSKAKEYIEKYQDYPMIDALRYREIGEDLKNGKLSKSEAKKKFKSLISKETDLDTNKLDDFFSAVVDNFL